MDSVFGILPFPRNASIRLLRGHFAKAIDQSFQPIIHHDNILRSRAERRADDGGEIPKRRGKL